MSININIRLQIKKEQVVHRLGIDRRACVGKHTLALAGLPMRISTSVGRKYLGSIRTNTREGSALSTPVGEGGVMVGCEGGVRGWDVSGG